MVMFDVVEEILSRLLVKDLLRCKSVCKSWYSLISSPSFVRLQCKYGYDRWRWRWTWRWTVGGSSNGLVCVYSSSGSDEPIRVTNPLTRKCRELLRPPRLYSFALDRLCLGFGYDTSTDDYKVVIVMNDYSDDDRDSKALVHILNLKSNIWKPLGHFNYRFNYYLATPGILYNEALHWFWFDANDTTNDKVLIVSFDLAKEEFREIPQPDDTRYVWGKGSTLGIIEGRLCIFTRMIYVNNNPPFCVWVIKNYNVKPSWELLPITDPSEMKDHAIHYMLQKDHAIHDMFKDYIHYPYYCDDNIQRSRDVEYIRSPIFVQTLVSPYVNNHGRRINQWLLQKRVLFFPLMDANERREIEEVYTLEDGEKNAFHLKEDGETERNKRKRKRSGSRN
ncbi:putative F-box domain-containing protein [Tanacetum coccineum]